MGCLSKSQHITVVKTVSLPKQEGILNILDVTKQLIALICDDITSDVK